MVIGSRTAEGAGEKFATMEIDLIQVKGKKQPEAVFTVLGRAEIDRRPALQGIARTQRDRCSQAIAGRQWDDDGGA